MDQQLGRTAVPPLIGVNVPWLGRGYGHDLGRNAGYADWPTYFDESETRRLLQALRDVGVRLLRIWLFEDGEGLTLDRAGRITGMDAAFQVNLASLVRLVTEFEMKVYWVLLDANSLTRRYDAVTRSLLVNRAEMLRFCELVLPEVLGRLEPVSWAVDICNEPEAAVFGASGNNIGLGFEWSEILPSLQLLRDSIAAARPHLAVSTGSGYQEHRNLGSQVFQALRLDFLDFHSHHADSPLPHAGAIPGAGIVVGELGVCLPDDAFPSREWWQHGQRLLLARLHQCLAAGYEAVFLWYLSELVQTDPVGLGFLNEIGLVLHSLPELAAEGLISLTPNLPEAAPAGDIDPLTG